MQAPRIISVHLPKCAGSALGRALRAAYGESVKLDTGDRVADPSSAFNIDPEGFFAEQGAYAASVAEMKVVHGHFHPAKYAGVEGGFLTTVVREPLERALSHYFFWRRTPPSAHAVWRYMLEHDLDFPAFCRLPWINQIMIGLFFKDFDVAKFDLVGFSDRMEAYIEQLNARAGVRLDLGRANVTVGAEYAEAKARYLDDPQMRSRLEPYFAADLRLYDTLRARFA